MERSAARDFVKSLSEKLTLEKDRVKKSRIHLQDSLNVILEILRKDSNLEIRSIRDFETNEVACFVDVYSPDDFLDSLTSVMNKNGIISSSMRLSDYKFVFIADLENRIISSGYDHNIFSMEVVSKRLKTFKVKISPCDPKFSYSVYEKNYHQIKYWFHEDIKIQSSSIELRNFNRDEPELKTVDEFGNQIKMTLNELGEMESFSISTKRGRRKNQ